MLVVKSTLSQRIKALMVQDTFGRNALPMDAVQSILNVSAVIKRAYDPNIIPQDIGRTWINTITGNRRVSNDKTAISDWISQTTVAPTADITGWTTNIVRTATDYNTVARAAGSIKLADGTSYSISAGNTGNMSAITYIYLDRNVSTTVLQQSTNYLTAVGAGKIMVCVAKNSTSPTLAQFQAFGTLGNGVFITADNLAADSVTANAIATNSLDGYTITGALIRTAASGIRSQLDSSYFRSYDANYERIRLGGNGYQLQFRDANGNNGGMIYGEYNAVLGDGLIRTSGPLYVGGVLALGDQIIGTMYPYNDNSYDIGTSSYFRQDLYMKGKIYFATDGTEFHNYTGHPVRNSLGSTAGWMPYGDGSNSSLSGKYVATSSGGSPTTQLRKVTMIVGGTSFDFLCVYTP